MARFDVAETVNNILSGGGDTARQFAGKVLKTATDLARLPGVDVTKVPILKDVSGTVQNLGGALGLGGARQAAKPKQVTKTLFNPFDPLEVREAVVIASKLMEIAERKKGSDAGLADAIGALASLGQVMGETTGLAGVAGDLTAQFSGLVGEIVGEIRADVLGMIGVRQHALKLFVTHYPPAREKFPIEPLEQRQPIAGPRPAVATPPEDRLSFWREDVQLNDHHGDWHVVNPVGGRPVAGGPPDMGDRHGELFLYMHEQMLARYDAERLGVDLPRVEPLADYRAPIPQGYDPGSLTDWRGEQWVTFGARPADARLREDITEGLPEDVRKTLTWARLAAMENSRRLLREAAQQGQYEATDVTRKTESGDLSVTSDNLGDTIESNILSIDYDASTDNWPTYGNLHSAGHANVAQWAPANPDGTRPPDGVMLDLNVTVRDPAFWRWHRHIDTIAQDWRKTLGNRESYDFADGPPVTVRSEDIILCGENGLPDKEGLPVDYDDERLGAIALGYSANANRWDNDFSSGTETFVVVLDQATNKTATKTITTTAELTTEMRKRTVQVYDPDSGQTVSEEIEYLSHEDFSYFIRLQNRSEQAQQVAIRIFLAPECWIGDNTAWIEMDRFLHRLAAQEHAVVFRPARLSAVIRKPALGHQELESTEPLPPATTWCHCGWPYNLLLPRSTEKGLDFRLLVVVTSGDLVMTDTGEACTSMSYCGVKDRDYPDTRPMGYPFDRLLPDNIDSIINKHDNWASRKIRIRCRNC